MFRFQGAIDVAQLGPPRRGPLEVTPNGDLLQVRSPGVTVAWRSGAADAALSDGVFALSVGRARDGDTRAGSAQWWIERYARNGFDAPADVGGAFSVVVVDFNARQVLLFVDRFSIEPLCYRVQKGVVGFADAACEVPGSAKSIDAQSIYDYLYFHVVPSPSTIYSDVRRVEPAASVIVTATATELRRYWQPRFAEDDRRALPARMREFVDRIQASVAEEADETATACFLSGGTDSSTVAGMLSRIRGEPAHAYSIGFDSEGFDEMAYARIAARHFGLVHHEYYVTPDDLVGAIPKVAASYDQPFGNSSVLPAYFCALRAKEDGFNRMLAGDGGDELFGGNSRYAFQKVLDLYNFVPATIRRSLLEPAATQWKLFHAVPGLRQLGGYVRHSSVPMPDRLQTFQRLDRFAAHTVFEPDFQVQIDTRIPLARQRATWNETTARSLVNRMLAYDWKYTLADNDLPKVRGATQLAGVSVGYPFLSRALTDFSLTVPADWKVRGLTLRWFFKRALRNFLPVEILRKKKHGFGLPFGHWMTRHAALRDLATESLECIARRGIVRPDFASDLLDNRLREAPGYYGELVWILLMLEQWLRAHKPTLSFAPSSTAPRAAQSVA